MAAPARSSMSQTPLRSMYICSGVTVLEVPARPLIKSPGKYFVTIAIDGKVEWKSREIRTRQRKVVWDQKEDKHEFESASNSTWKVTLCKNHSHSKPVEEMGSVSMPLDGWMQRFMVAQLVMAGNDQLSITVQLSVTKKDATIPDSAIALHESVEAADEDGDDAALLTEIPGLGAVSTAVDEVGEDAGDVVEALNGLLGTMQPFITLMDKVSEVHPYLKMSWAILSAALKAAKAQQERDEKMQKLIEQMKAVYDFLSDAQGLKDDKAKLGVLSRLALQTVDCAHFISSCIRKTNFATRLAKQAVSNVDSKLDEYKDSFQELLQYFQYGSQLRTEIATMSILEDVKAVAVAMDLNYIPFTGGAGYQTSKRCLADTRTKLLDEIGSWANNSSSETPRLFVLMGPAGTGKSTIAHTMVHRFKMLHRLGASFCFSNEASANRKPASLFRNIARNLAQMYPAFRTALWNTIQGDMDLCTTEDLNDQFDKFILEPARSLAVNGVIFIMIDALDESGTAHERQQLLIVLFRRLGELPTSFRFFITCRGEDDIRSLIPNDGKCGTLRAMPTLADDEDLRPDILEYVRHQLSYRTGTFPNGITNGHCQQLSTRAEGLFQWAFVACNSINSLGIKTPLRICETLLRETAGGGPLAKLDTLYKSVLQQVLRNDQDELPSFKATMGFVLSAVDPLSRRALRNMMSLISSEDTLNAVVFQEERVLSLLGSLLSGVGEEDVPVRVLHSSFRELLLSSKRGGDYYIGAPEVHHERLATASLRLLNERLFFNMGRLKTSYKLNKDAISLEETRARVPEELSYACKHWGIHLSKSAPAYEQTVACMISSVFKQKFLFWLDAASITDAVGDVANCITAALGRLQKLPDDVYDIAFDGIQFIRAFGRPIAASAAHTYVSALVWAPVKSKMAELYRRSYGQTARVASGLPILWPSMSFTMCGHRGGVRFIAFSPNGKRIASGSEDNTIRLWETQMGVAIGEPITGHMGGVWTLAFSPDGSRIASGSDDWSIRIWDAETGKAIGVPITGHVGRVNSVAFSPDGRRIVSGSSDKTVRMWDAQTGVEIWKTPSGSHTWCVSSVAFFPNGKQVVSGSRDRTIRIWDSETGEPMSEPFRGHDFEVRSVAISPDGRRVVSSSHDATIRVWYAETGEGVGQPIRIHDGPVARVVFSPDGRYIASCGDDHTTYIWDTELGMAKGAPLTGHTHFVECVAFSPDGRQIASCSRDRTIRIWGADLDPNWEASAHSQEVGAGDEPEKAEMLPRTGRHASPERGNTHLFVSPEPNHQITHSYAPESLQATRTGLHGRTGWSTSDDMAGHGQRVRAVTFSPDGKKIASGSDDNTIRLWETQKGAAIGKPLTGHTDWVWAITFSADGSRIASGSCDMSIRIWDAETGEAIGVPIMGHTDRVAHADRVVRSVAFSADGRRIVSGSSDRTVRMWDVQTGVEIWKTPSGSHTWCVTSVAFSLNGKQVVSGSSDYTLRFWDSETGEARSGHLWGGHRGPVWSIAISRDGQKIVSGSDDSTIRVWRAETGEAVGQLLRIHEGRVNSVAFSPDGRYFASGGADHMIHIWDTETGMPKGAPLIGHAGIVRCVAFSPDGRSIASCSDDRTIRIWDAGLDPEWESFQALHGSWDCQRFALSRHPAHQMKQLYASDSTETTAVWYDRETGWIMGNEMDHILWIPPHLFDRVSVGRMKVLIPGPALVVDLSKFAHGTEWQTCFTDSSSN